MIYTPPLTQGYCPTVARAHRRCPMPRWVYALCDCDGPERMNYLTQQCLIWDDEDILVRQGEYTAMITTHLQLHLEVIIADLLLYYVPSPWTDFGIVQKRVCEANELACDKIWEEVAYERHFIADTENFEVWLTLPFLTECELTIFQAWSLPQHASAELFWGIWSFARLCRRKPPHGRRYAQVPCAHI